MPDTERESKSKSQQKREHRELQVLAESLVRLSGDQMATVPVSDVLRQNVIDASAMKKGAFRRQVRYLARLLAVEDVQAIRAAVESARFGGREESARLHRIERWRERLVANEPGALADFISAHPDADRQQLRQLVRAAREERARGTPPRAFRRLFEIIRGFKV